MEQPIVRGVAASLSEVLITVAVPAGVSPAGTARVLRAAAGLGVPVGTVSSRGGPGTLAFTVPAAHGPAVAAELAVADVGSVELDEQVGEVALLGAGLRSAPAVVATFCEALARAGVPLAATSFESRRLAALCPRAQLDRAVRALCEAFEVGAPTGAAEPLPVAG
ncbi:ACT domain-containing protein [Kitasatospora sp. NPDC006697]|uniref:ACT domain-containing protein n=1 Tax=Kitasatospora sp. NPDC006697 TaxID=3364020 RepID=UPI00369F78C9